MSIIYVPGVLSPYGISIYGFQHKIASPIGKMVLYSIQSGHLKNVPHTSTVSS